jgi:Ni/Co efflux regulator RcnB
VQLPARPGYQWVVVDNDVVLIVAATGLIADILSDVL